MTSTTGTTTQPRFPIYIPSKGRADTRHTARALAALVVPYRLVIEEQEWAAYRKHEPAERLLVLDPVYQRDYDDLMHLLGGAASHHTTSKGSGPARNFIWDHAKAEGHTHHWTLDDNIRWFGRMHRTGRVRCTSGVVFRIMEDFMLRYDNLAMVGPIYETFARGMGTMKPYTLNTRIFSCSLIRTDLSMRWRGRYNEDAILSLDMLKAGWCTVQFTALLQAKMRTQTVRGGNAEIYAGGTLDKSRMLVAAHPDVARLAWRFGRHHHYLNLRGFTQQLRWAPGAVRPTGVNEYGLRFVDLNADSSAT